MCRLGLGIHIFCSRATISGSGSGEGLLLLGRQRDLAAALDIAELASCVRDEVARRPRVLLERVAADIARAVIERFERVAEVRVKIEKPEPDGLDAAAEAVEVSLTPRR